MPNEIIVSRRRRSYLAAPRAQYFEPREKFARYTSTVIDPGEFVRECTRSDVRLPSRRNIFSVRVIIRSLPRKRKVRAVDDTGNTLIFVARNHAAERPLVVTVCRTRAFAVVKRYPYFISVPRRVVVVSDEIPFYRRN